MRKYTIAKYIRLSLEDSKYDSLSIPNQRMLLDRHIESLDIGGAGAAGTVETDVDVEILEFVDNGYTGMNYERPAVQELLALVRERKIDCICVKDFSRFGRNSLETGYFIERVFPVFQTRFIAVSDNFDSMNYTEDTGGMEVAFKFLMHEYYSKDLSRKSITAKHAKFARGEYQSVICPYGYRKSANGRMEPDENAVEVVRLIFETACTMKSTTDIVKVLRARNIQTPGEYRKANGKAFYDVSRSYGVWQRSAVLRILADERYTGMYVMGKRRVVEVGSGHVRTKDESEWVKIPNHHPAIVSKAQYDEAQTRIRHFKCPKAPKEKESVLQGKVVCGCCQHTMQLTPKKVRTFYCRYMRPVESAECHRLEIGEAELEEMLYTVIEKQAQVILDIGRLDDAGDLQMKTEQQTEYEKLIAQCRDEKQRLYEKLVLGELDVVAYKTQKAGTDTEMNRLKHALNMVNAEMDGMATVKLSGDKAHKLAERAVNDGKLTRPMVDALIDKVLVYPGNRVEIAWRFEDYIRISGLTQ